MDLNDAGLKYLYESYRRGTMRAASGHFNMAPSSISRQIRRLERQIGLPLIERGSHRIKLTHAGQLLLDYYRDQQCHYEALVSSLDDLRGLRRGNVVIAIGQGLLGEVIVPAIARFLRTYPGLRIRLKDAPTAEALNMVYEDEAHFGILLEPAGDPALQTRKSVRQPVRAIVYPSHPLAKLRRAGIRDILREDLILPTGNFRTRQIIEQLAAEVGGELDPLITSSSIPMIRSLIMANVGFALLPETVVLSELDNERLKAIPMVEPAFNGSEIHLVYRQGRTLPTTATVLLNMIEEEIARGSGQTD